MNQQAIRCDGSGGGATAGHSSRWRRSVVAAVVVSAALLVADTAPSEAAPGCSSVESGAESRFVSKLNDLRRSRGLSVLTANPAMAGPADEWASHMSTRDRLYHARDTGGSDGVSRAQDYVHQVGQVVTDWSRVAENVGVSGLGSCSASDSAVDALHDAFVDSPGHFANMVGDFNQVGVGVHTDADELWVTVRFAKGSVPAPQPHGRAQLDRASRYVRSAYGLFLGRDASDGDVSRWSGRVAAGDRADLTRALATSREWSGTRVNELYQSVLGRDAEPSGLRGWVDAIRRGTQLEYVAAAIYGSPERYAISGSSARGYVEGLYRDVLDRPADAGGRDYWVRLLDRGTRTRTQVAAGFYGSLESRTDRVHALYQEILGRAPDPTGLAHWTRRLTRMGDVVLASTLATSTEYWNRATR